MKQSITEKTLTAAELKKREEVIKQLKAEKSSLVKRYGKDAEKVMYGRATNIAKKAVENMNKDKIREMVKTTLMGPVKEDHTSDPNDKYVVKYSKENNTYQVWEGDYIVDDFSTPEGAKAKADWLNMREYIRQTDKANTSKNESEVNEEEAEAKDAVDTVTMDVPLFIRMLEFAREDAKGDIDLHDVAEKAIEINKSKETLSMQDYEDIIPAMEEPVDEVKPSTNSKLAEKIMSKLKPTPIKEEVSDLDTMAKYITKYVTDPNEAEKEISKYKLAGFQALSEPVKSSLRKDMDFITWVQMQHDEIQLKKEKGLEETAEGEKWVVWINMDKKGKEVMHTLDSKPEAQKVGQRVKNRYYDDYDTEVGMMSLSDWNKENKK